MVTGVFHADPHPGNVLLLADGRLGLLDFGSVGRLDGSLRSALQRLLLAIDRGDPPGASDALLEVVLRPDEIDERLERALGQFMARHLGTGASTGRHMFGDLFRLVTGYGLWIPPEIAAVFRALATLEGTLPSSRPGSTWWPRRAPSRPGRAPPSARPGRGQAAGHRRAATLLPMLRRLPRRLDRIAGAVEQGRLGVEVRLFADERDRAT